MVSANDQKIQTVKEAIAGAAFMKNGGFVLSGEEVDKDSEVGDTFVFNFESPNYKRKMQVLFSPQFENIPDTLAIYVVDGKKNMKINKYLVDIGVINKKERFELSNYKGSFEQKLRKFIHFLGRSYDSHWKEILLGKKWMDVGVDWGDYK